MLLVGPSGVGRRRLAEWLATTGSECGACEVHRGGEAPPSASRTLVWVRGEVSGAPQPIDGVVQVGWAEVSIEGWEEIDVRPLQRGSIIQMLRNSFHLTSGLAAWVADRAAGRVGRAIEDVLALASAGELHAGPDGYARRVDHRVEASSIPQLERLTRQAFEAVEAGDLIGAQIAIQEARLLGNAAGRHRLRLDLVDLRITIGGSTTAEAALAHADALIGACGAAGESVLEARARVERAGVLYDTQQKDAALEELTLAEALAPDDADRAYAGGLLLGYILDPPSRGYAALEAARDIRPEWRSEVPVLAALASRARHFDAELGVADGRRAVAAADAEATSPHRRVTTRLGLANALLHVGDLPGVLAVCEVGIAIADGEGLLASQAWIRQPWASALSGLGRLEEARQAYLEVIELIVVDASGQVLPAEMIHHGGVINLSRRQIASPAALRIFGIGQETDPVSLPSWMGMRMSAGEQLMAYVALVNPSDTPVEAATLRIVVDWRPADADVYSTPTSFTGRNANPARRFRRWRASIKDVVPLVLYAQPNGPGEPEFDVGPGVTTVSSDVVLPMSGHLRAAGGHMHDHASEVRLEDAETGRVLVRLAAELDPDGSIRRVEEDFFPFKLRGVRLEAGHRYRVVGVYENPTGELLPDAGMAYIAGAFLPDDLSEWPALDTGHPKYVSDLAGVVGEGSGGEHAEHARAGH